MSRKQKKQPYWEMNTSELREATKEFDREFVANEAQPLTPAMRSRWKRAKAKPSPAINGREQQCISVELDSALLEQCTALAKKKRISRDALIACGLKALFAAEGDV